MGRMEAYKEYEETHGLESFLRELFFYFVFYKILELGHVGNSDFCFWVF